MRQLLRLVIGLLACFALANALPGLFPRNDTTTYKYYADIKSGTIEPTPYASEFALTGFMHVKRAFRELSPNNAFYIVLNVTYGVRNGEIQHFEKIQGNTEPLPDAAKVLNDPFVVVFDDNGKVERLMVNEHEPGWSRNMKKSMASMLQLDLSSMNLAAPMTPQAFLTKEDSIYGECAVSYDVHPTVGLGEGNFTVTKMMDPMSCTKFNQYTFNHKESTSCLVEAEEEMTAASRRIFHIVNMGQDLLIRSLVAHGVINYFPWRAKSEAHYILANQSIIYESTMPVADSMTLPEFNLGESMILNSVAFQRSESLYAPNAGMDPTFGRHVVDLEALITKLLKMLGEAADYMNENNLLMTSPELKHGQTMNRIMTAMTRMDLPSLENIFNNVTDATSPREVTIKNLFLKMVPYVGTTATCLLTRNIIRKGKIDDNMAIAMMTKLPFYIREPTNSLLVEMEGLMTLGNDTSLEVRKSGILSFATMINKAHQHDGYRRFADSNLINRWVRSYYDNMLNAPTFEMKMVYLHGMRNIQIGDVHKLLEPMIRGEQMISERPDYLRLHAMLVNWGTPRDFEYIHGLYWPILCNTELPVELRVVAYTILIEQPPRLDRMMSLYWLMVYEKNEHLYNYHYTTLKSLANTVNSCTAPMMEMARKILRFTRVRPVSGIMTGSWLVDFENRKFGFGEAVSMMMVADNQTGVPFGGVVEYMTLNRRKPVHELSMYMRIEGVDVLKNIAWNTTVERPDNLAAEIKRVMIDAGKDMPSQKPVHIEFVMMIQRRTVFAKYFDKLPNGTSMMEIVNRVMDMKYNIEHIEYDEFYTMQAPNDLGLPSILRNMIPHVTSVQINNVATSLTPPLYNMKMEAMMKNWRHGRYSMAAYNPIIDIWHAICRISAYDVNRALSMSVSYNQETGTVKMNIPMLPLTQHSISGTRSFVNNYVMMTGIKSDMLEQHCGTCRAVELVTKGAEHMKNTTLINYDSRSTGLRFSMYKYHCERVVLPKSRSEISVEMMNGDDKNAWDNMGIVAAMAARNQYLTEVIGPELGNCGHISKLEPSILYPTSEIDINMRMSVEAMPSTVMNVLPGLRFNFRGTLDAKAAATNISVSSWSMTVQATTSQGHVNNNLQVRMTQKTPGETDLQVCVDGYKIYPAQLEDPFIRVPPNKEEIIGKLTMTMGRSDNATCVRDDVSVMINMKAELSGEQKEAIRRDLANGSCEKDMKNPNYMFAESSMVPRTLACMREAMAHSALRKYSYTIIYQNIPEETVPMIYSITDDLRGKITGHLTYLSAHTDPGIIKIFIDFPLSNEKGMNMILRTPTREEKYTGVSVRNCPQWTRLESTRFSWSYMANMETKQIKPCVIYPEILLNSDGAVVPLNVSGQWTLLTCDHIHHMFSVFIKRVEPKKLALLMTMFNHTIEVTPSATVPTVTIDGRAIDYVTGELLRLSPSHIIWTAWTGNRLVITTSYPSFDLEWTGRSVRLGMSTALQGKVTGLCGHLDGTHSNGMSTVYSFES